MNFYRFDRIVKHPFFLLIYMNLHGNVDVCRSSATYKYHYRGTSPCRRSHTNKWIKIRFRDLMLREEIVEDLNQNPSRKSRSLSKMKEEGAVEIIIGSIHIINRSLALSLYYFETSSNSIKTHPLFSRHPRFFFLLYFSAFAPIYPPLLFGSNIFMLRLLSLFLELLISGLNSEILQLNSLQNLQKLKPQTNRW